MLRSTDNFDPVLHGGPEWFSAPPEEMEDDTPSVPDCDADFNDDAVVNGIDLAILLSVWGEDTAEDLNQDEIVDGTDLAILLGMWGGCP